jgi:hypothetical protein
VCTIIKKIKDLRMKKLVSVLAGMAAKTSTQVKSEKKQAKAKAATKAKSAASKAKSASKKKK